MSLVTFFGFCDGEKLTPVHAAWNLLLKGIHLVAVLHPLQMQFLFSFHAFVFVSCVLIKMMFSIMYTIPSTINILCSSFSGRLSDPAVDVPVDGRPIVGPISCSSSYFCKSISNLVQWRSTVSYVDFANANFSSPRLRTSFKSEPMLASRCWRSFGDSTVFWFIRRSDLDATSSISSTRTWHENKHWWVLGLNYLVHCRLVVE